MNDVTEHPIIFAGPLVRAILDGSKTQTRRPIKPQPKASHLGYMACDDGSLLCGPDYPDCDDDVVRCPYGQPGDRLWVRERFYIDDVRHLDTIPKERPADLHDGGLLYHADANGKEPACCHILGECACGEVGKPRWRPSIHMPRWSSRITLEVTGVRVERLQDISEHDAEAEGATFRANEDDSIREFARKRYGMPDRAVGPRECFSITWDRIYVPKGMGWYTNPWVWVVEFRKVE